MKCSNCGAEIKNNSKFCEFCGSQISVEMKKEQEQLNKAGCPKCGSSNITFDREVQGEVKGKKGKSVVRSTVGVCRDCGYTWTTTEEKKKGKTWLWVLGWIFIFPLPLTILLLRKKDMKPALKYGIIAAAWVLYIIFVATAGGDDADKQTPDTKSTISVTDVAKQDDKTDVTKSVETNKSSESEDEKPVEVTIESNVNSDDGTVLFGVTADLPEDTKLTLTLSNSNGFSASDTVTILNNGKGYTSEFDEEGKGLNGDYVVTVTDKNGETLATKDFSFSFEAKEDVKEVIENTLVDPDLKAFLDSYEAFMDEYCEFMESYDSSDMTALLKYSELMVKYADFAEKADAYDADTMSEVDSAYYLEVMLRVNNKLAKIAYSN